MTRKHKLSPTCRKKIKNIIHHLNEDDRTFRRMILEDRKLRNKLREMI
jgi:hypothetical protein